MRNFVQRSVIQWKTQLMVNGDKLGEVNIKRESFKETFIITTVFIALFLCQQY